MRVITEKPNQSGSSSSSNQQKRKKDDDDNNRHNNRGGTSNSPIVENKFLVDLFHGFVSSFSRYQPAILPVALAQFFFARFIETRHYREELVAEITRVQRSVPYSLARTQFQAEMEEITLLINEIYEY